MSSSVHSLATTKKRPVQPGDVTTPAYETSYALTADLYWPEFNVNNTETVGEGEIEVVSGALPFGNAVRISQEQQQCGVDTNMKTVTDDEEGCLVNPVNCPEGISMSVFYKMTHDGISELDPDKDYTDYEKQYIMSTGGEPGSPGVGVYLAGPFLVGEVSTGDKIWRVPVVGNLPQKDAWTNIGISWKMPDFANMKETDAYKEGNYPLLGGLHLYLNMKLVGYVIMHEDTTNEQSEDQAPTTTTTTTTPAGTTTTSSSTTTTTTTTTTGTGTTTTGTGTTTTTSTITTTGPAGQSSVWPRLMIGCHATENDPEYRFFLGGDYDEIAIWKYQILQNETAKFYGGLQDNYNALSNADMLNLLTDMDVSDPEQQGQVFQILEAAYGSKVTPPEFRNIEPEIPALPHEITTTTTKTTTIGNTTTVTTMNTTSTTTAMPKEDDTEENLDKVISILQKLIEPELPNNISREEMESRLEVLTLIGGRINPESSFNGAWEEKISQPEKRSSAQKIRDDFENYGMKCLEKVVLDENDTFIALEQHGENSFHQSVKIETGTYDSDKYNRLLFPMTSNARPERIKREVLDEQYFNLTDAEVVHKWTYIGDSVDVPSKLFSGFCTDDDKNYLFSIYDNFPDSGLRNPASLSSKKIILDSKVLSIKISANKWDPLKEEFTETCQPDANQLVSRRIFITLLTKSKVKAHRGLNFHENELDSEIEKRHCAIWNPNIGQDGDLGATGAWDTKDIETVFTNELSVQCITDKLGTYAIIAELVEHPVDYDEPDWLFYVKIIGYIVSIVVLLVFCILILSSKYLWEQFNIIIVNLNVALILGHICMVLVEFIEPDRHMCAYIGEGIHITYTAAVFLLTAEAYAVFRAITTGVVVGKAVAYVPQAWGLALVSVGVNMFINYMEMGTDPICFIGWENNVKWYFFIPLLCGLGLALVLSLVVMCNLGQSVIRGHATFQDVSTLSFGLLVTILYFVLVWLFGVFALIRMPEQELTDVYPAFQVFNSWSGVPVAVLLGVFQSKARSALSGELKRRQEKLLSAARKR